jgi:hypothetical protein
MVLSTSTMSVNLFELTQTKPGQICCINCGDLILESLTGSSFSLKLKCIRCKAKITIEKI